MNLNSHRATMPKSIAKNIAQKEIVSAMVKLNQEGYEVPVNLQEIKNLPKIPNTGTQLHHQSLVEGINSANLISCDNDKYSSRGLNKNFIRHRNRAGNRSITQENQSDFAGDDESFNVYDLVHRGREIEKKSQ